MLHLREHHETKRSPVVVAMRFEEDFEECFVVVVCVTNGLDG